MVAGWKGAVRRRAVIAGSGAAFFPRGLGAQKRYDDGATDSEIRIGHTNPYSGPAQAYGVIGKSLQAYWDGVNDAGGINGRRVKFISLDDGYSPPKTVECVRQLVEQDRVLCLFNILGTPTNTAIHRYVNQKKVPHLFPASGASKWADPANFPWTMGFQLSYRTEGAIYAQTLAGTKDLRIGILMQNDEYGRDYVEGFRRGLGPAADRSIVKHVTYEVTDPAIDSQILQLKNAGVDVWLNISTPKFAAMAIRMAAEIKWSPVHFLNNVSASVASVMQPAGLDAGREIITAAYLMDPTDNAWTSNADMAKWRQWMRKYNSATPLDNSNALYAYCVAFLMEQTLRKCGDNLTRENVMRQAANHQRLRVPGLLPGITVSTSRTDYFPIESGNLMRFNGRGWELFGELISAESS